MSVPAIYSDTGPATLPDTGTLNYNDVLFSCLYKSHIDGRVVSDDSGRITKIIEYTLYVEGLVTSDQTSPIADDPRRGLTLDQIWVNLRSKLTQQGGFLQYFDKGFGNFQVVGSTDLGVSNANGNGVPVLGDYLVDYQWGPKPELLEFTPLGVVQGTADFTGENYGSAFVRWQVKTWISEVPAGISGGLKSVPFLAALQFSYGVSLQYDERGYAHYSYRGVLEIPSQPVIQGTRVLTSTVDAWRSVWLNIDVDLSRYRVTDRTFEFSPDRRTLHFSFQYQELPPGGLPPGCTVARGTFSVRNQGGFLSGAAANNIAMMMWHCSLRCTYTVRADQDQRIAFFAFLALLWWRITQSTFSDLPGLPNVNIKNQQNDRGAALAEQFRNAMNQQPNLGVTGQAYASVVDLSQAMLQAARNNSPGQQRGTTALMTDFAYDEGQYLDSDTITFHASWILTSTLQSLLAASGFCTYAPGTQGRSNSLWKKTMRDIVGWRSWQAGSLNPSDDAIIAIDSTFPPIPQIPTNPLTGQPL